MKRIKLYRLAFYVLTSKVPDVLFGLSAFGCLFCVWGAIELHVWKEIVEKMADVLQNHCHEVVK